LLLPQRRDALLDLLDALSGSPNARSPVELSLSSLFQREYGSIRDAIANFFQPSAPQKASTERRAWENRPRIAAVSRLKLMWMHPRGDGRR